MTALASLGLTGCSPVSSRALACTLAFFLAVAALPVRAEIPVPALRARVNDLAQLLPPDREQALEAKLARYEAETSHQLAVLTIDTTDGEAIEPFAMRVAEQWKLGRKGVDDGAVLIVAKQDRTARIEVGYGLEGPIPDAIAKRIIEDAMIPRFRAGDFPSGIEAAVEWMMRAARGEALPAARRRPVGESPPGDPIAFVVFLSIFASMVGAPFRKRMRPLGALLAGGVAGGVAWFLLHLVQWSALAFALGALFGWIGPTMALPGARRGGFGGGGFGGGGFGGGGGFSGGGGGFGGGGASGRW